ncbi:MAG: prolipoprotein diacylglyceryl transferase family protein [Saprospiraceae bacterium]
MYPDLSYLFHDLLGTAPDNWLSIFKTFGFVLALSFLVSALVFNIELRRKAREGFYQPVTVSFTEGLPATGGEILANAIAGLLIAGKGLYAYQHYGEFRHDPASVILSTKLHWTAGLIGAAVLAGITWWDGQRRRKDPPVTVERQLYPHDRLSEMTVMAAIGGILGAKIFDVFDNWESFLKDPVGSLASGGGLAFFGGLVMGFVMVVWFMWRHKIPFWPTADAVAPALTAGYGFGRIGCQLSGDGDWGKVNIAPKPDWMSFLPDWMWAYRYPQNVLKESVPIEGCEYEYCMQLAKPVYPTPFYEVVLMIVVFGILWALRKRIKPMGMIFFIYLALIAIERFFIEKIRVNVEHDIIGIKLTQAEIISILLFVVSLGGMIYLARFRKES